MAKLPSIQGLRDTQSITVRFEEPLFQYLEQRCRAEWLDLHRIDHPNETASPFVPASEWLSTSEGHTHNWLFNRYFMPQGVTSGPVDLVSLNRMLSRLQAQRYTTQGTRKRFETRVHSATDYRKFRNWWINKNYAEALGVEFAVECPYVRFDQSGPTESYMEMGEHFEEWTGVTLPTAAWADLQEMEAQRSARRSAEADSRSTTQVQRSQERRVA